MSNNVRRLALDIGPWVWAYIVFQLFVTLVFDILWLRRGSGDLPLLPGVLLIIGAQFSAQKVPFWRTLPVSRAEIDRARWWQSIAAPPLLFCAMGVGAALVIDALGRRGIVWPDIAMLLLAQSAVSILIGAALLVVFPFAALRFGRWSALLLVPYMIGIFRITRPWGITPAELHSMLWTLVAVGLAVAVALYALVGRWPSPLTVPLWSVPPGAPARPGRTATKTPRPRRGWQMLVWANLPALAFLWLLMACLPLAIAWFKPGLDLSLPGWIICLVVLQLCVFFVATGMRVLRALPLSGWQLTCRLVFLMVFVHAISVLIFNMGLSVSGGAEIPPVKFLLPLAFSLIYLPVALRFGLRVVRFGLAFSFVFIIPLQIFRVGPGTALWIVAGSLATMAAGSAWTYWEITRGHNAYRIQPLVPARWRGF